jgi:ZF-HD class homeobox domain-containing protein
MLGFAEEAGWRLQKLDDAAVQRFCQEVGVKRRVLKVWMHNNKHTLARRGHDGLPGDPQPQQGPHGGQLGMPLAEPGGPGRSPSRSPPPQLRLE